MNTIPHPVVLFDGYCNFCNRSVNFLIRHDKKKIFRYATLQSEVGNKIKSHLPIPEETDSIIFFSNNQIWFESDAVLQICKHLPCPFKILVVFLIIPKGIKNSAYKWIAKNRYHWFGRRDSCRIPNEEEKCLFLKDVEL